MKNKIIRTFLTAILVHILLAITLYYTLGWTDELPDELTARPTLVLLGTFASAVLWFNNFRVLFYVIDVSDRKSIDCKIILGSLGKMNTIVRKSFAIVLAICILLPSFIATAIAADVTDGFSQKASDSGYFCVDDLEKNSDILIKTDTDAVTFVEDGLQIYLSINTPYIYRDTYIIGAMKSKPIRQGGKWYVPKDFYDQFLCAGNVKVPSIFNGAHFFAQEIMTALYENCDGSFSKKLLDAILLPSSMGIGEPHLDMSRVFVETPLTEYPNTLMSEMKRLGIKNPEKLTYGEYAVINGTQSLASAGMAAVTENNPELSGIDSNTMTVAEYTAWQQSNALQNFKKGLSTEAMDFAAKKGITLSDLSFLNRYFYGNYMEETDNNLRNALLQFYSTDVEYLQNQANPFADIAESDWFYDDVLHSFFGGLIKGTSNDTFSPDTTISRGQIITILYRLDGEKNLPDSSEVLPFPDVSNSWYSDAVHWATHEGIINGYNNGKFGPNDPVTREQIAVILWRYAKYAGYEMSTGKTMNMFSFDDASDISEFAIAPMQWAYGYSIINGTSSTTLSPQGYATRAQFAAIICRFCAKVMK